MPTHQPSLPWQPTLRSLANPRTLQATMTGSRSPGASHRKLRLSSPSYCSHSRSRNPSYSSCPTGRSWKPTAASACTYDARTYDAYTKVNPSIYDYDSPNNHSTFIYDDRLGSQAHPISSRNKDHASITHTCLHSSDATPVPLNHLRHTRNLRRIKANPSTQTIYKESLIESGRDSVLKALLWVEHLRLGWVLVQPYGYTGRRYDSESDLWYFRARYFDSDLGRFIARDPAGYIDGYSMYRGYFAPNALDPSGMVTQEECEDCMEQGKSEPQVQAMLNAIANNDTCVEPSFECVECPNRGRYFHDGRIQVNPAGNETCEMVKETVRHEVIHAFMHCIGKNPPNANCEETICTELAAYSGSGQCEENGSDGRRFKDAGLSRKECIIRGAATSSGRKCGSYHEAKKVAERLWASCGSGPEDF